MEHRRQCPGAGVGPRRHPHLLSAGYSLHLRLGQLKGLILPLSLQEEEQAPEHKPAPAAVFTRMSYRLSGLPLSAPFIRCLFSHLLDWFAPCSRV